jgi:ABC-type branched-subunit amino acid transport system ATPase component
MPHALEVNGVTAAYGAAVVLRDVGFTLDEGTLLVMAGPNGGGKSTLLRTIAGLHRQSAGEIRIHGKDAGRLAAHARAHLGLAWVPEGRGVVPQLSVEENLDLARFSKAWTAAGRKATFERYPILEKALKRPAWTLSGGEQQMLALGRALETGARLLLVDEPSLGLAPLIVRDIFSTLQSLRDEGYAIVLVEEKAAEVVPLADRILLMRGGDLEPWEPTEDGQVLDLSAYSDGAQAMRARA